MSTIDHTPSVSANDEPPDNVMVIPWDDPVVERNGYDVRSTYVELFWLNVLGPTATWLLRRLVFDLDRHPLGYELDIASTAGALGLSYTSGTTSTFAKSLNRCIWFGVAQRFDGGIAVRRRLPPIGVRHLQRMPAALQHAHAAWQHRPEEDDDAARARAWRLTETMLQVGDDADAIERQLLALGVRPGLTLAVVDDLTARRRSAPAA
jgi:hypothetical protein